MDCQALVAHLTQDTVILTAAVQLGVRWRELAEKLARLTKQQIEAYEIPHQGKSGEVSLQVHQGNHMLFYIFTMQVIRGYVCIFTSIK